MRLQCCTVVTIRNLFITLARNKDSEDNKKDLGDGKEQLKTALGRRASGVTTKMSKPGEQVRGGQQSRSRCKKLSGVLLPILSVAPYATGSRSEIGFMLDIIFPVNFPFLLEGLCPGFTFSLVTLFTQLFQL